MKLKPLIVTLILPSLLLAGCDSAVGSGSGSATATVNRSAASLGGAYSDTSLWTNIVENDSSSVVSNEDFVVHNHTDNDLEFVGCDSTDKDAKGNPASDTGSYVDFSHMHDIGAHYHYPITTSFDPRWKYLSDGIKLADPAHITDYSIHFKKVPTAIPDRSFACYYRIKANTYGDPMYVKLVNHFYYFTTYQMGQQLKFQPQIEQQELQQEGWLAKLASYDVNGGLSFASATGAYFNYARLKIPAQDYLDQKLKSVLTNRFNDINACLAASDEICTFHGTMINSINVPGTEECGNGCEIKQFIYRYNEEDQKYTLYALIEDNDDDIVNVNLSENEAIASTLGFDVQDVSITTPSKIAATEGIDGLTDTSIDEILSNYMRTPGWYEISSKLGADDYAVLDAAGMSKAIWGGVLSFGVDVVLWTVINPLINSAFAMPAVGAFDTTANHLYFAAISPDEANSWNSSHDAKHQIQANTKVTLLTNSSIHQKARFTYNDTSHDQQYAVDIDLSSLTTPWVRQDSSYKSDPFLSCIAKTDCSPDNPTHKGDAVIQMDITDNNFLPTKDLDYVYDQVQAQQIGLSQYVQDTRLPAPEVQLSNIVDLSQHKTVYAAANLTQGNVYSMVGTPSKLQTPGTIAGIGIVPNQQYTFNVNINSNTTTLSRAVLSAESTPLVGGGFGAIYVAEDESGATTYLPVHSDGFKARLDQESNVLPYLYSKFNCSFPNPVGQSCPLQLSIGGNTQQRSNGMLYIADANSKTTVIPVYLNARLVAEPFKFVQNQGSLGDNYLTIKNFGSEDYAKLNIVGLPNGVKIKSTTCSGTLKAGQQCSYDLDLSQVQQGNYAVTITGLSNAALTRKLTDVPVAAADQETISINIAGGW